MLIADNHLIFMQNKIKVILSTFGPLHLIKSAEFLSELVDISVIQGWIPKWWNRWLIAIASWIIGRDLSKSFKKRTPQCLEGRNYSIGYPEFYQNIAGRVNTNLSHDEIAWRAAAKFGRLSKIYISGADIFHVRSGSGRGGAIDKARNEGMKIVVDHSIAHPAFMDAFLRSEFDKNGAVFSMGMDSTFWKGVLADCNDADRLLVNSYFVRDTFVENGYDDNKISVVYLGVRKDFVRLKKTYEIRGKLRLLFTGSFGFRKGGEYLLRAMQELDGLGVDYEMTIVGSYEKQLVEKFRPKNLNLVGFVPQDELKKYLSESDVYVFPSLCEGCASSAMEAMAAGLPVIATKETGLPAVNGESAKIIEPKNVKAIVDAILDLRESKQRRAVIGQNAASLISSQYTWEKYAENVMEVYQDVLKV